MAEKKSRLLEPKTRQELVDSHESISVRRQSELLGINRTTLYYDPVKETNEDKFLMKKIDEIYTRSPFYGSRRITAQLQRDYGMEINRKRVQRMMRALGLRGIAPGPDTSKPHKAHKKYPYLLRKLLINRVNMVWSTDITYVPMTNGFMYLVAVIDWYSRYVLSWKLSNTMDTQFCIDALEQALTINQPDIFNTDQGVQFTSEAYTTVLLKKNIQISMDGRGRALDNIFVERLWRTVKYENIYMNDYQTVAELKAGLSAYFTFYNEKRLHQSLDYNTPLEVHFS